MIRKSSANGLDSEHHSAGSGARVEVGMAVDVEVTGTTVGVGKLVGEAAGSDAGGSVTGLILQADSKRENVKNRGAFFIVHNYSLV